MLDDAPTDEGQDNHSSDDPGDLPGSGWITYRDRGSDQDSGHHYEGTHAHGPDTSL